jgi:hypothetical protein
MHHPTHAENAHSWAHHLIEYWGELAHELGDILDRRVFLRRMLRIFGLLTLLGASSVAVGAVGFHLSEGLSWLDSFYWATMVITGGGLPVLPTTAASKVWGVLYAFYGASYFAGVFVAFLSPIAHHIIQRYVQTAHRHAASKKKPQPAPLEHSPLPPAPPVEQTAPEAVVAEPAL